MCSPSHLEKVYISGITHHTTKKKSPLEDQKSKDTYPVPGRPRSHTNTLMHIVSYFRLCGAKTAEETFTSCVSISAP